MKTYLRVAEKNYLKPIIQGLKSVECISSNIICPPFNMINVGDKIVFKEFNGFVLGETYAKVVIYIDNLTPELFKFICTQYKTEIMATQQFINDNIKSKYLSVIWLEDVFEYNKPYKIKNDDQIAWILYDEKNITKIY